MQPPAIWRNRERRTNAIVLAVFLWAPFWIILGLIAGPPILYAGLAVGGAPFAILPFAVLAFGFYHASAFEKALTLTFILGAVSAVLLIS